MINQLTEKQQEMVEVYRQRGLDIGNSTKPADWESAEAAIKDLYVFCGFKHPENVYRVDSPKAAQHLINQLMGTEGVFYDTHGYGYGQHESSWVNFYEYWEDVVGIEYDHKAKEGLDIIKRITNSCGFYYMFDTTLVICDRPEQINLNEDLVIHNEKGPAIRYRDGFSIYAINGHTVPSFVIEEPEKITAEIITNEGNAECKRIMMEIFGISEYLVETGAKVIDVDAGLGLEGSAMRSLIEDNEGNKWLVGSDGSTKRVYHMPVAKHVMTCGEAHKSISGIDESNLIAEA